MSKTIMSDKRVESCDLSDDSDYKYEVILKTGFAWGVGRNEGYRLMRFNTVAEFVSDARYVYRIADRTTLQNIKSGEEFFLNGYLYKATADAKVVPCKSGGLRVDFSCLRRNDSMPSGWELASICCQDPDTRVNRNV